MSNPLAFLTSFLPSISIPPLLPLLLLPTNLLPNLIPTIPQNLQNKLLNFLFQKFLGKYLKFRSSSSSEDGSGATRVEGGGGGGGGEEGWDPKILESDLSKGQVKIYGLELSKEAIDPILKDFNPGLSFQEGTIGYIFTKISTWPFNFSSSLVFEVEDLILVLNLRSRSDLPPSLNLNLNSDSSPDEENEKENEEEEEENFLSLSIVASQFLEEESKNLEIVEELELLKRSLDSISPPASSSPRSFPSSLVNDSNTHSKTKTKVRKNPIISLPGTFQSFTSSSSSSSSTEDDDEDDKKEEEEEEDEDENSTTPAHGRENSSKKKKKGKGTELESTEVSLLTSLIDRILKKLSVRVKRITLRLILDDEDEQEEEVRAKKEKEVVEIRIEEVSFANEDISVGGAKGEEEDIIGIGGIQLDRKKITGIKSFRIRDARILLKSWDSTTTSISTSTTSTSPHEAEKKRSDSRINSSSNSKRYNSSSDSDSDSDSTTFEPFHGYENDQDSDPFPSSPSQLQAQHQDQNPALEEERNSEDYESSSTEDEEEQNQNQMLMSQSIADLRNSTTSLSLSLSSSSFLSTTSSTTSMRRGISGDRSMYASARGSMFASNLIGEEREGVEEEEEEVEVEEESPFFDPDAGAGHVGEKLKEKMGSENVEGEEKLEEEKVEEGKVEEEEEEEEENLDDGFRTIFSIGKEEIAVVLSTSKIQSESESASTTTTSSNNKKTKPEVNLHCIVSNPITFLLLPQQLSTLIKFSQILLPTPCSSGSSTSHAASSSPSTISSKSKVSFTAAIRIKSITLIQVYELPSSTSSISSYFSKVQSEEFWKLQSSSSSSSSTTTTIPFSHLRFKIEDLGLIFESLNDAIPIPNSIKISIPIRTFSLVEGIKLSTELESKKTKMKFSPIFIEDKNLGTDLLRGTQEDKGFESYDWIEENKSAEMRGWKLQNLTSTMSGRSARKTGRSSNTTSSKATVELVEPALNLVMRDGNVTINIQPIHLFLDLTFLERLQPFVEMISNSLTFSPSISLSATQTLPSIPSTPKARPTQIPLRQTHTHSGQTQNQRGVLEDLHFETTNHSSIEASLEVNCNFLRIEIRCPPPFTRVNKHSRRDRIEENFIWEELRSGIAIVDIRNIGLKLVEPSSSQQKSMRDQQDAIIKIDWETVVGYFLSVNTSQAIPFFSISALVSDLNESISNLPKIKPSIKISSVPSPIIDTFTTYPSFSTSYNSISTFITNVDCDIPFLKISLDKSTLDSLQFFIDDLTQWSGRTFGDLPITYDDESSSMQSCPTPKMVGSRYFGTKSFSRSGKRLGSESEEVIGIGNEQVDKSMAIGIKVTDVVVDLFLTRLDGQSRYLNGSISDIDVKVELLKNSKNDLHVEASISDLSLRDCSLPDPIPIISRTMTGSLTRKSVPLVFVDFTSSVEKESGVKESKVQLVLSNFTYYLQADTTWVEELSSFVNAPEGAFEAVVPNELTRVRVKIVDVSIHITPSNLTSRLIILIGEAKIATNLMPDIPRTLTTLEIHHLRTLAIGSNADLTDSNENSSAEVYWKSRGFVQLLHFERAVLQIRQGNGLVLPDLEVLLSEAKVDITICADSASTIQDLIADLTNKQSPSDIAPPKPASSKIRTSVDLLASLDPSAFTQAQQINETLEYIEDDVPSNKDYLSSTPSRTKIDKSSTSKNSTHTAGENSGQLVSDIAGETIRMLDPRGLIILTDYLTTPQVDPRNDPSHRPISAVRCRMADCEISIHIHEGYDWSSTRKAIEEQAKLVRRRLEKIRQLLANGQTPDSSADEASVLMFGSIQLGLPPGSSELTNGQLLVAINEELDERSDAASSTSSWQPLSGQPQSTKPTLVGKARKRLTRSSTFAIEINLHNINASFDSYLPSDQLASRIKLDVSNFDIIDNIRTSTWKKFLTELRPSDGGVVRASGTSMIRFEMNTFRSDSLSTSSSSSNGEEISMKISPLRLYIDQDALDFLKAFGGFKNPSSSSNSDSESSTATGPFFQRVEIMAVKIKLDYKPKRVDYHALRKGKVAELMNFFHFDGSEITLRHLVVTGVSGSTRLSDLVQDIWTPDVKANQLADVISGIAPVRSVVNVGSGVANLVLLPIEQYRKDGRLVRGLQKGATAFAKTTTLEALNVGARLATGTQVILEQAEAVLGARFSASVSSEALAAASPEGTTIDSTEEERVDLISRYAEQPGDLREGLESAYRSLGSNFRSAAQTILAVPMEVYERSGTEGPVRAVIRAVPIAVLKPMIGATEAASKALFGLRNTLDKDLQAETADKYKKKL